MTKIAAVLLSVASALALVLTARSAEARIACDGPYQVVGGQSISTPYCQDNHLAEVARAYGMRVSAAAVRSNPGVKAQVCRHVGYDNRVQTACAGYRDDSFQRRHF